jgi:hypothetical protein
LAYGAKPFFEKIDPGWGSRFRRVGTIAATIVVASFLASAWIADLGQGPGIVILLLALTVLGVGWVAFGRYMNFIRPSRQ